MRSPCLTKNSVQCSNVPREESLFGWEHRCTTPALCVHSAGVRFTPKADISGADLMIFQSSIVSYERAP